GLDAFGIRGPTRDELLTAELWFLLDCPLPSGETPIALRRRQDPGRKTEMLARSELRAWRVASVGPGSGFTGLCALGTGRARIDGEVVEEACVRYLVSEPEEVRARLADDPELIWLGESDYDGALRWRWRWDTPAPRPPLAEPGVRFELCDEDAADVPYLAEVN